MSSDKMVLMQMNGEPLREATDSERVLMLNLAGLSGARLLWVSGATDGGRVFIVCPAFAMQGVAIGVDRDGRELWRKPAFYSELLKAGDGYESQCGRLRPTVRGSFDGTWIPSVRFPDGSSRRSERPVFDERAAKELARELAGCTDGNPVWKRTQG
jgi:hypothetical protein